MGLSILQWRCEQGKTLTSLGLADKLGRKNVLFVTKKKAISSIESDYATLNPNYNIVVINYESLHKIDDLPYDMMILDEAHTLGAFPKPSKRGEASERHGGKAQANCLLTVGYANSRVVLTDVPSGVWHTEEPVQESIARSTSSPSEYVDVKQRKINSSS